MASGSTRKKLTDEQKKKIQQRQNQKKGAPKKQQETEINIAKEITLIGILVILVLIFISNFGMGGLVGKLVRTLMMNFFGIYAYVMPIVWFWVVLTLITDKGNGISTLRAIAFVGIQCVLCALIQFFFPKSGGILGSLIYNILKLAFGKVGTLILLLAFGIIAIVILSGKSFIKSVRKGTEKVNEKVVEIAKDEKEKRKERSEEKRRDHKVTGVNMNLDLRQEEPEEKEAIQIHPVVEEVLLSPEMTEISEVVEVPALAEPIQKQQVSEKPKRSHRDKTQEPTEEMVISQETPDPGVYQKPPLRLLNPPKVSSGKNGTAALRETAMKLQQILKDFGVNVTVTDVSCGPSVTRYELQPEQGVKVSRILALADDLKLNLAVTDIRIEAPIPGKAAVGIEVPNKENTMVTLRELLSSEEFNSHKSNLAFAVGKDIGGKTVITDIAKMPHLLIAGATGSGKSVCINTLIMSLLYKSAPEDVRLIMIDPKVVELSAYNGIPHLLIPVVTDPKKAAGALNWAVAEMTRRYQLFADCQVRNLEGYNAKVQSLEMIQAEDKPEKLPQIVIIVDELADLMMVAPGDVEDAICRLAQLARAAGIHLIIATQRPSVNVITGLIKANMPSRLAFAVSSGVDSRTILDMNGAEKLLGKGDMLFYPYGYPKPVRIQGAFVSDDEVSAVVSYLRENNNAAETRSDIEEHIQQKQLAVPEESHGGNERDPLFTEAGKFILEKEKASIGMLQRWFKIGFNRAARIMDQLAEAGVVGEEQGTKPREILMSPEQFEQYIEENV